MKKFVCLSVSIILLLLGCAKMPTGSQPESILPSSAASPQSSQTESFASLSGTSDPNIKSNGEYKYKITDNSVTIVKYIGKAKDVAVLDMIDGFPVKVIGDSAFMGCRGIETLKMPDSIELIENNAFEQTNFKEFIFPPKITVINRGVFLESGIQKAVLPEHVQEIKMGAFFASALFEINIPDSVTAMNEYPFQDCPRSLILFYENNPLVPQYAQENNILCFKRSEYNPVMDVELVGGKPLNDDKNLGISKDNYNLIDRRSMNYVEDQIQKGVRKANNYKDVGFDAGVCNVYSGFDGREDISQTAIRQKLTKLSTLLYQCGLMEFDPQTVNTGKVGCFDQLVTAALYCRWPEEWKKDEVKGCDVRFAGDEFLYIQALGLFNITPDPSLVTGYSEQQHGIWYYPKELPEVTTEELSFDGNLKDGNYLIKIKFTDKSGSTSERTFSFSIERYDNVGGSCYRIMLKSIQ